MDEGNLEETGTNLRYRNLIDRRHRQFRRFSIVISIVAFFGSAAVVCRVTLQNSLVRNFYDFVRPHPLLDAVTGRDEQGAIEMLNRGADPNDHDDRGRTPLMRAANLNEIKVVRQLILSGADVNAVDYRGRSVLYWADRDPAIQDLLIRHGAR